MYIKKSITTSLFLFFIMSFAYAGNIGRNVYGVYCESLSGSKIDGRLSTDDNTRLWNWRGLKEFSTETTNANEGVSYLRCHFDPSQDGGGGGIAFVDSSSQLTQKDMSAYYNGKLKLLVKKKKKKCADIRMGIKLGDNDITKLLSDFSGFDSSKVGEWQEVSMTLNSTTSDKITLENLAQTSFLFLISSWDAIESDVLLDFDYVRWVKENAPTGCSIDVKVKNVSDHTTVSTSSISWNSSKFHKSWQVAEQYLEVDYDSDTSIQNWNVKLYVDNGSKNRNGLFVTKDATDYVMTMCWRACEYLLPYDDADSKHHTLQIAQGYNETDKSYYLYDSGSSEQTPVWLYMQDLTALVTDKDKAYSTVMGYKTGGYHAFSGNYDVPGDGYYAGSKINLYLGANCDVPGRLKYEGKIVVALEYE